jgi:UDP-2-acetamido-3-amino-2,3-dideoxy-glucuronate N-acetyltransferase
MSGCHIGPQCNIGQNVNIASGVRIGRNVKIQNNVSIYTGVELEDDVFCGPSMVFTNVINPRSHVNRKSEYQRTLVKRGASLGANSTIVCGVTIGEYALVGAGAVVTRDVLPYAIVVGVPARQIGWMCVCGTRLEVASREVALYQDSQHLACAECGKRYAMQADGSLVPDLLQIPSELVESTQPLEFTETVLPQVLEPSVAETPRVQTAAAGA